MGEESTVMGGENIVIGVCYYHGVDSTVMGVDSTAMGVDTTVMGTDSRVEGNDPDLVGQDCHERRLQ